MGMHENHRERVRERFLSAGLESFPPHNVLELLLFFSIPRRDTNVVAHRLLERFGSLVNVLEAEPEQLGKVEGVGPVSVALIKLVAQLAQRYLAERSGEKINFNSTQAFRDYVASKFMGASSEVTYLFCLDNAFNLLQGCPVSLGTKYSVSLDNRTLLETAFLHKATKVVLAHNHPNGLEAPSTSDIRLTEAAVKLFREVNIQLLDHLIVANGECFSMAAHRNFWRIFSDNVLTIERQRAADVT